FCQTLCQARGVAFTARRVQVPREGRGVEAAARNMRYQAYGGVEADFVALAHHLDDQAETFLLQLLRGAGPKGLSAMPTLRKAEGGKGKDEGGRWKDEVSSKASDSPSSFIPHPCILRPLLEVKRSEVVTYAKARKLEWIEDDSNADSRY